ncbi:hypothetical protein Y600_3266 [Burkholderia pseudomallei MSHR3709]|nr:hypothetical protein Y600_3266 [Burkholderia pseudomallei MSHR3709]
MMLANLPLKFRNLSSQGSKPILQRLDVASQLIDASLVGRPLGECFQSLIEFELRTRLFCCLFETFRILIVSFDEFGNGLHRQHP